MRAVVQEFLDLLSVASVIPQGVLQCSFHAALAVFVSWLCHSQFFLPSPSMESALLLLIHLIQSLFILLLFPLCPHFPALWVSCLFISCSSVFANVLPLPPDSSSQLPAQRGASGGARVGVQGCLGCRKREMYRLMTCTTGLCLCCWDTAMKLLKACENQTCSTRRAPGPCSLCQLGCGLSNDWAVLFQPADEGSGMSLGMRHPWLGKSTGQWLG